MAEKKSMTGKGKLARKTAKPTEISIDSKWRMYDVLIAEHRHLHNVWMDNFRVILTFNSILLPGVIGVFALIFKGNVTVGGTTFEVPMWPLVVLSSIGVFTTVVMMMIIQRVGAYTRLRQREIRKIEQEMLQDLPIHPFLEGYAFGGGSIANLDMGLDTEQIRNKWFNSQIGYALIGIGFIIAYILIGITSVILSLP